MPDPDPRIAEAWDYSDPAGSEARFGALIENSDDEEFCNEVRTQIARTYGLRGEFDKAHEILDGIPVPDAPSRLGVRVHLERGRALNSAGNKPGAYGEFGSALLMARKIKAKELAADTWHMLAIAAEPAEEVERARAAIAWVENEQDESVRYWLGPLYNNLAWAHIRHEGNHLNALHCFEKALAQFERTGSSYQIHVARWSAAHALRKLNGFSRALKTQLALATDNPDDGFVQEEIGECLLGLERPEEAAPHFARAHQLLSQDKWLVVHEADRLERIRRLGNVD